MKEVEQHPFAKAEHRGGLEDKVESCGRGAREYLSSLRQAAEMLARRVEVSLGKVRWLDQGRAMWRAD
jgi:hypothetical protein